MQIAAILKQLYFLNQPEISLIHLQSSEDEQIGISYSVLNSLMLKLGRKLGIATLVTY